MYEAPARGRAMAATAIAAAMAAPARTGPGGVSRPRLRARALGPAGARRTAASPKKAAGTTVTSHDQSTEADTANAAAPAVAAAAKPRRGPRRARIPPATRTSSTKPPSNIDPGSPSSAKVWKVCEWARRIWPGRVAWRFHHSSKLPAPMPFRGALLPALTAADQYWYRPLPLALWKRAAL